MMWYYCSPVGTFTIAHDPQGGYGLWLDTDFVGSYPLPDAAAEAVRTQQTGCADWDRRPQVKPPSDLDHWMMVRGPLGTD